MLAVSCTRHKEKNYTIFYGGTILTVDEAFSEVEALVIEGQKIIGTGSFDVLKKEYGESFHLIDLIGRTRLPGFVDLHAHVVNFAPIVFLPKILDWSNLKPPVRHWSILKTLPQKLNQMIGL